jgi:hypothetical protein
MNIHLVCELTEKYRRGGRVVVGHMANPHFSYRAVFGQQWRGARLSEWRL